MKDKFEMVGKHIEEFSLPNSRGETVNIKEILGRKNIFISLKKGLAWGHWRKHIQSLANHFDVIDQSNTIIIAITEDVLKNAIEMEQKYAQGKFPIYYDESKEVLTKLGQEVKVVDDTYRRMPAVLIVDKEGIIQYAYYGNSGSDNPKIEELLEAIGNLK